MFSSTASDLRKKNMTDAKTLKKKKMSAHKVRIRN